MKILPYLLSGLVGGVVFVATGVQAASPRRSLPAVSQTTPTTLLSPLQSLQAALPTGRSLHTLQQQIEQLQRRQYTSLQETGAFFLDLQTGNYLSVNGETVYPTASMIKVPILMALFQAVEAGTVRLDERLVMTRDVMAGGSGNLRLQPQGSEFSVLETATKMITISDNTATNMIIKRLGGVKVLTQQFRQWGLQQTTLNNYLPDIEGTNVSTPQELVQILALLDQPRLLSPQSRAQILTIMQQVRDRRLLPSGLGRGAAIAHKTGDIGFILGDTGIVQTPSGKRYLAAILVKSKHAHPSAKDFIRQVSQMVYNYVVQGDPMAAKLPPRS